MIHIVMNTACLFLLSSALVVEASINAEHRRFADALTTNLYENENECSSALGVSMAFSLIYPGSTGESTEQIRTVMGYPSGSELQLVWKEASNRLDSAYEGQCQGGMSSSDGECQVQAPILKIANSVWLDDNRTLATDYEAVVGSYVHQIDFEADDSPVIVNDWVKNQTSGLIDSIVPADRPLYPPRILIAINSIYLKASWLNPFREQMTNNDSFYSSASRQYEVTKAHFMHQVFDYLRYSHEALPGYQMAQLPFSASDLSMVLVLPMSDDKGTVTSSEVITALAKLETTRVALGLPKFKFESTYENNLKDALQAIGIIAPFFGDLCGLYGDCGSFIDKVIQKTVIDVNEIGVEAAAVTALTGVTSVGPSDNPILMMLDHPFQFFIYDHSEELVIFEGRLGAPAIPEGDSMVSLLSGVHSEGDFWSMNFNVDPVNPFWGTSEPTTLSIETPSEDPTLSPTLVDTDSAQQTSGHASFVLLLGIAGALTLALQ